MDEVYWFVTSPPFKGIIIQVNQLIKKNNVKILGVIVLVMLCTQVFPYIHFHHTHDDNNFNIIVSSHPINHEKSHNSEQHNGEHQHQHKSNEHIEGSWNYVKTVPRLALKFSTNSLWITDIVLDEQLEQVTIVQIETNYPPPKQILFFPSLSRGPPAYLS